MRGLRGDLGTMPIKDIVLYLGNKRATGTLGFHRANIRKEAQIHEGMVVSASSNQAREFLGQFLINMGHLTEDQFMKAYETQKETKIFLGKILVMIGLVPEDVVRNALSMKLRETLLDAFEWNEGEFAFTALSHAPEIDGLDTSVDLLDIYREGEFRETAWQAIRGAFPHGGLKLRVNEKKLPEPPKPGTMDEKIVRHAKEGLTIEEMLLAMHATDFYAYQRLYALYRLDAIQVDEGPGDVPMELEIETDDEPLGGPMVVGDEPNDLEIGSAARAFLHGGNFKDAEALARRAFELNPSTMNADLLRQAETGLLQQLRGSLLGHKQIPSLLVTNSQLKGMDLTAPEKYLLSRIDGERDLASIIHVSPLQEGEALKLVQNFLDNHLIRLIAG
ncbi:MAG: DUF4388 domain-containing protein [Myxococcota bacterium]|nr:DUF4388 domain-containing protein [Myxococcota bacterium]